MAENADMPEDDEFLLGFKFYGVQTSKKRFSPTFLTELLDISIRDV